jgi:Sulfatase
VQPSPGVKPSGLLFRACGLTWRPFSISIITSDILLLILNIPALAANAVDIVYFGLSEKRITHEFWTTKEDLVNINIKILAGYWYLFIVFGLIVWIFYRILKRFSDVCQSQLATEEIPNGFLAWVYPLAFALTTFAFVRGGNPIEPLTPEKAFLTHSHYGGNLGLNSGWTVLSSLDVIQPSALTLQDEAHARKITQARIRNSFDGPFASEKYPLVRKASFEGPENKYNIVILFIESFNALHVGALNGASPEKSLTPNMDTLVKHARLFSRYYANASRSVEALPSGLNSLPEIFLRPTLSSRYESNHTWGIGNMLKARGYYNAFFCPARSGSMGFDHYSKASGIDHYFGMNEYPDREKNFDGLWGCFDGPFLQWMLQQQNQMKEPFLNVFFSVSNHHPFALPEGYDDLRQLPGWDLEKTTAYTDRVLGDYFREASKQPWYDRTIFIVTGDHTFHEFSDPERSYPNNFHVPLWILAPGIKPGIDDRLGNHVSLLPTLIDILKLDTWHASTGISLFDSLRPSFVVHNLMEVKGLTTNEFCYTSTFLRPQKLFRPSGTDWMEQESYSEDEIQKMEEELQCLYQTFFNARNENRIIGPEFMTR